MMRLRLRQVKGRVSTDDILPARYKHMYVDPEAFAGHVFENLMPGFASTLRENDCLFCDSLFGIGSSREQAVTGLKAAGIRAVLAPAFGRIFFRNAWNNGLMAITTDTSSLSDGETVAIDVRTSLLAAGEHRIAFDPIPEFFLRIIEAGGLLAYAGKTVDRGISVHVQEGA